MYYRVEILNSDGEWSLQQTLDNDKYNEYANDDGICQWMATFHNRKVRISNVQHSDSKGNVIRTFEPKHPSL